ncbi:hypothetical protein M2146_001982 [Lachnospiraceae bacterium PF1-22]|uniref:hypothetical protein n=1 Tax=Ohessyouella blattaphilus TaxID=2949333 RepID=UPI003E2C1F2A
MKKGILLLAIVICLLPGCGLIQKEPLPEWTKGHEMYKETYKAIRELEKEQELDFEILTYEERYGYPIFSFGLENELLADVFAVITPLWENQEVPMFGFCDNSRSVHFFALEQLAALDCKSLSLALDGDCAEGHTVADIKNLEQLKLVNGSVSHTESYLATQVKHLLILASNSLDISQIIVSYPNLEEITFLLEPEVLLTNISKLSNIASLHKINLVDPNNQQLETTIDLVSIYEDILAIPTIEQINGVAKADFDMGINAELQAEIDRVKIVTEVNNYCSNKAKEMRTNELKSNQGTPRLEEKLIVYYGESSSIESAISGEAFEGIPAERLAKSLEEADTVALVYGYYESVGFYTGGGIANKTYTMVVTVDMRDNEAVASHLVATENPPQTITIHNNLPTGASGELKKKDAMNYLLGLL